MRHPDPLPDSFRGRVFTRAEALRAGVSPERLRRRDIRRVSRGTYRWLGEPGASGDAADDQDGFRVDESTGGSTVGDTDGREASAAGAATTDSRDQGGDVHATLPRAADILDAVDDACVSHLTAALLRGWWLPESLHDTTDVHVIRPITRPRLNRRNVITHRTGLHDADVVKVHGRRVTSVPRTWLDCATLMSLNQLVLLGDSLVRRPRTWADGRRHAWTTIAELHECLARYPGTSGITKAREALGLVRVGSDSPQESLLRLALCAAGLPEPELQIECWDPEYSLDFPATADLGYPESKVAIQYEGEHHGSPGQMARDLRRDQAFIRQGWTVLRFGSADSRDGFRTAVRLVSRTLRPAEATTLAKTSGVLGLLSSHEILVPLPGKLSLSGGSEASENDGLPPGGTNISE